MAQCECKDCGYVGVPVWVHNDDKCEKCYSRRVFEVNEYVVLHDIMADTQYKIAEPSKAKLESEKLLAATAFKKKLTVSNGSTIATYLAVNKQ